MLLSERLTVTRVELESQWSIEDAHDAHDALDLAEDMAILVDLRMNPDRPGR